MSLIVLLRDAIASDTIGGFLYSSMKCIVKSLSLKGKILTIHLRLLHEAI